jgi:hypothetical protein
MVGSEDTIKIFIIALIMVTIALLRHDSILCP